MEKRKIVRAMIIKKLQRINNDIKSGQFNFDVNLKAEISEGTQPGAFFRG